MNMNGLFELYERECVPSLSPRSQRDYKGILVILRRTFGHLEPQDVKPQQIADFINVPTGRVHRNRMVTILSTVFKKAMGRWCLDLNLTNPCTVIERWPTSPRERYVTDAEFNAFRATACPQIQIAMDLALLTGQRQGDIIGLTWDQVDAIGVPRDKWVILIDQGKTGKKLAITITPAVEAVLSRAKMMPPNYPHDWVIRTEHGYPYTEDGFRALWQRTMRAWMKAGHANFHFHDLRAKCISDNDSLENAYLLAGHIDMKMTRGTYDRNRRRVEPLR